jgi:hypothetical protein
MRARLACSLTLLSVAHPPIARLFPAQEQPLARATAVAEWILALLATKQAHPESVTLEEVGPLMGLLYAFPRDERVQAAGAEALALIAMDEGDAACLSAEDLVEEGAITVLKEAMRNHRKNAALQEQAGSALLHMASRSTDVAIEIQQAGGTRAISAAIKLHPVRGAAAACARALKWRRIG